MIKISDLEKIIDEIENKQDLYDIGPDGMFVARLVLDQLREKIKELSTTDED